MSEQFLRDTHRRIRNVVAFGATTAPVSAEGAVPSVQVRLQTGELLSLTVVEKRGVAQNLPVGTPVMALFAGGDRSNGVVVGTTAPGGRPPMAGDADVALYGYGFTVLLTADGVEIAAPKVKISGDLEVMGEVTAKAGSSASVTLSQHKGHDGGGQAPTPGT